MKKRKVEKTANTRKVTRRNGTTVEKKVTQTQPSKVAKKMGLKVKEPSNIPTKITTYTKTKTKTNGKVKKDNYQRFDFSPETQEKIGGFRPFAESRWKEKTNKKK